MEKRGVGSFRLTVAVVTSLSYTGVMTHTVDAPTAHLPILTSRTNRALVEFRRTPRSNRRSSSARSFARYTEDTGIHWGWSEGEQAHASKVLRRLAAFRTDGQVA